MSNRFEHVVSFSGGKDSTAMLFLMLEKGMQIDRIVFIDTQKEFPELKKHIQEVENRIKPLTIEKYKMDYDYWFSEHEKVDSTHGYEWPDFKNRWCTGKKIDKFIEVVYTEDTYNNVKLTLQGKPKVKDIIEYHGIAYNEPQRIKKYFNRTVWYPLFDAKMTGEDALNYCYNLGFDWDGLYEHMSRVSCYCCPFQRLNELKYIYEKRPELWRKMMHLEKISDRRFTNNYSLTKLSDKFKKETK